MRKFQERSPIRLDNAALISTVLLDNYHSARSEVFVLVGKGVFRVPPKNTESCHSSCLLIRNSWLDAIAEDTTHFVARHREIKHERIWKLSSCCLAFVLQKRVFSLKRHPPSNIVLHSMCFSSNFFFFFAKLSH